MHVVLLTTSYPTARNPSSGVFVARLVENLPSGVDAIVLAPSQDGPAGSRREFRREFAAFRYAPRRWEHLAHGPGGIPVALRNQPLLYLMVPQFLLAMVFALWRLARGAQVLHANWAICGLVVGLVGRLLSRPVVTTLRGEDVSRAFVSRPDRWILAAALRLSSKVVTVSTSMADHMANLFPRHAAKIVAIPNGVEDAFLAVGRTRSYRMAPDPLRLITVGSLIPRKGIDLILAALASLPHDLPLSLEIVGDGPQREHLETQVRHSDLSRQVAFAGKLPPEKIAARLEKVDGFVLASRSEGRPNVLLEAMATGLPVIASAIPGVTELVKNGSNGLLFQAGAVKELTSQIQRLVDDVPLGERLGRRAHQDIVAAGLVWSETGSRYAGLYRSLSETH